MIKKLLFSSSIFICANTAIFTLFVFPQSIDSSQRIAFSFLVSIPICILIGLFLLFFPSVLCYSIINLFIVPSIKIIEKLNLEFSSNEHRKDVIKNNENLKNITSLKIIAGDKILGDKIKSLCLKLFQKNEIKLRLDNFYFFVNFLASHEDLYLIVNFPPITKILLDWDFKKTLEKLDEEERIIDLFIKLKDHTMIRKEMDNLVFIKEPSYQTHWLENIEDWLIMKKLLLLPQSNYVKNIKKRRIKEEREFFRRYIRYDEIQKKLFYLRDLEIKEEEKLYKNDDHYYL